MRDVRLPVYRSYRLQFLALRINSPGPLGGKELTGTGKEQAHGCAAVIDGVHDLGCEAIRAVAAYAGQKPLVEIGLRVYAVQEGTVIAED